MVGDVVVGNSVIGQREGRTAGGIGEVQHIGAVGLPKKLSTGIHILMLHAVDGFACPQAVQVVGIGNACAGLAGGCELTSILPREVPAGSIVVTCGITAFGRSADGIGAAVVGLAFVGDAFSVERGEQVCPACISVGISMILVGLGIVVIVDIPIDQIAGVIVEILIPVLCHAAGIVHGGVTELIQYIVGIACIGCCCVRFPRDSSISVIDIPVAGSIIQAAVGQGGNLCAGLAAGDGLIGEGLLVNRCGGCSLRRDRTQALNGIVAIGQGFPAGGGHGCHGAVVRIVGIAFGEAGIPDLPGLGEQAALDVVGMLGVHDRVSAIEDRSAPS